MTQDFHVLFIIHDLYQEDNHFPMGIGYLASILRNNGINVEIYNQDVFHFSNDQLKQFLKDRNYDIIGIGFLAARYQETIRELCHVVNQYKKNAWLVLGGHGPSPIADFILKDTLGDIVVIGEGEETILDIINAKKNNSSLDQIKGIAYRLDNEVFTNQRRKPIQKLDTIPFPAWDLFPMNEYSSSLKMFRMEEYEKSMGIITSRGCINKCNFCYRMERGIRFRSIKNVVEEISLLIKNYQISYFNMMDELFVYPKKRIFEFKEELERHDLKIKFACNARVDEFDQEVAESLKEAGCQFLNFGMESSHQSVLDKMNKNTTVEQNIRAAEISKKIGIGLGLNFIWGNIGDSEESLNDNVKLIKKYNTYDQLRTIRPVTPYPGCDLYYYAIENGLLKGPTDFFNKFKNSDLITVNFTEIPDKKCYQLLYNANKELILDYYNHTTKNYDEANKLTNDFYSLYFEGKIHFRGARHYSKNK